MTIVVFMVIIQISFNLNASLHANAVEANSVKYHVSKQGARVP